MQLLLLHNWIQTLNEATSLKARKPSFHFQDNNVSSSFKIIPYYYFLDQFRVHFQSISSLTSSLEPYPPLKGIPLFFFQGIVLGTGWELGKGRRPPLDLVTALLIFRRTQNKSEFHTGPAEPTVHNFTPGHPIDVVSPSPSPLPPLRALALALSWLGMLLPYCTMWLPPAPFFRSLSLSGKSSLKPYL